MPTLNKFAKCIAVSMSIGSVCGCFYSGHPAQAQSNSDHSPSTAGPSPSPPGAAVYFIDVKSGDTLRPKTIIHFGLRNMGVSVAGTNKQNSGHHHLLIDTDLPPLDKPIPNDPNHLHYGGGQTEAEISLTPGQHTLQLVMGDKDHIPHNPPVVSEKIRVNAVDSDTKNELHASGPTASPSNARVYFAFPAQGSCIASHSVIRFGLVGMGVAPAGFSKANTGHHHLIIDSELPPLDQPIPNDVNHLHFGGGQTEAEVTLSPGRHKLQLLFADERHIPHNPPLYSQPIQVTVGCTTYRRKNRAKTLHIARRNYRG